MIADRVRRAGSSTFRSLRTRNYRLYFTGQLVSIAGTWTQTIAQALLVLDLTKNNGLAAGTVIALQFLPTLCLSAWAGVLVDRHDKRVLSMVSQACLAGNAVVLAVLTLSGVIELWMIYAIVLANGMVTAFDMPLRQSYVSEMVSEDDLANAVALNTATFNGGRIIGPAIAAVILAVTDHDYGICFSVNAVSYLAVIGCLAAQRPVELFSRARLGRGKGQVREGVRYTWALHQVRYVVLLVGIFGTVAFSFNVTLPLMAKLVFHDKDAYSAMSLAMGVGSLIGALATASRKAPNAHLLVFAGTAYAVANGFASIAPSVTLMLPALALMGFFSISMLSTANALVQLSVTPTMRGRVMALYSMVLLAGTPLGNIAAGWISDTAGPRWSTATAGIGTLLGVALFGGRIRQPPAGEPVIADATVSDEAAVIGN